MSRGTTDHQSPSLLTEAQAAERLGVSRHYLRRSRTRTRPVGQAEGPPYIRAGRMIRYAVSDLDTWAKQNRCVVMADNRGDTGAPELDLPVGDGRAREKNLGVPE